jgi:protein farnesyltransferase/geranylgeranyltransferase type-1 subunit alpha
MGTAFLRLHTLILGRLFRASTLKHLKHDPRDELEWLTNISLKHLKNYQIWHHRQVTMDQLDTLPPSEISFLGRMLAKDVKNYHVWSYRQWLVRHFGLWADGLPESPSGPSDSELSFTSALLKSDLRNNSAWNHRFFVIFGKGDDVPVTDEVYEFEIEFAKSKIFLAPQNQSAWNYLKGVLKRKGKGIADMECFAKEFVDLDAGECKSSHALDLLADIWAKNEAEKAGKALDLLAEKYDPIRKNYWEYRKRRIGYLSNHPESRSSSAIKVD